MKKEPLVIAVMLSIISVLGLTNPKRKQPYLDVIAQQLQANCCIEHELTTKSVCAIIAPVTKPILSRILHLYTEKPQDLLIVTLYKTNLPSQPTFHGIGIGGHYFTWPKPSVIATACHKTDLALLSYY